MKVTGLKPLLLTFTIMFYGCERNVSIAEKSIHYDARIHLHKILPDEKLPKNVREMLFKEPALKFPLSYYLIQEEDVKFIKPYDFDKEIIEQLTMSVSGVRYFKLFIHPDSDKSYAFLMSAYRFIGPNETEFYASAISGNKSVIVWTPKALTRTPFIVKTFIENRNLEIMGSRLPADASLTPQIATLVFSRSIKGSKEKIQGQQITTVPDYGKIGK